MFGLGAGEIFIILAFALIFIGPKKLPELARSLGKGFREFQRAKDELMDQVRRDDDQNLDSDGKEKEDHHKSLTGVNISDEEIEKEIDSMRGAFEEVEKMDQELLKASAQQEIEDIDSTQTPKKKSED